MPSDRRLKGSLCDKKYIRFVTFHHEYINEALFKKKAEELFYQRKNTNGFIYYDCSPEILGVGNPCNWKAFFINWELYDKNHTT
jgi:hypothetical protein